MFVAFSMFNAILPYLLSRVLTHYFAPTTQQYHLIKSFSLLLLGLFLSSLATLNFSLSLLIGLLAAPLTYIHPFPSSSIVQIISKVVIAIVLVGIAPTTVLWAGSHAWGLDVKAVLIQAAFGWDVWGMTTQVVVWCVWWPAWVVGGILLSGNWAREVKGEVKL